MEPSFSFASPSAALMSVVLMWLDWWRESATSPPIGPESSLARPTSGAVEDPRMR